MAEDVRSTVGDNVRRLRSSVGLTQAGLAEKMGIDRGYISSLELGGRNPTIITLWHVAQALGVKIGCLFEEKTRVKRS
jgi:transcriptional regulator with XRE-family HTH domain